MLGLYIHIPFCSAICNYCNFNRGLYDGPLKDRYVTALLTEITKAGEIHASDTEGPGTTDAVDTIYFGGGTPSLLEPAEVARIIAACGQHFAVSQDSEVTLEANPETVTTERLRGFRQAGVNRLSFGVQSFRDDELQRLTRLHGAARARGALGEARDAGYENVSLDLMMWLPGQQLSQWFESVDEAIALSPEHVSMYLLEVYPNAPLRDTMARSNWTREPDDVAAEMYLGAMHRFDAAGYEQYEISNVARPGAASRHNLKYWSDGEWVGLGCGAHSTRRGERWKNVPSVEEYIERVSQGLSTRTDIRVMPASEQLGDALFTGLRLVEGVDLEVLGKRYGVDVWRKYGPELESFVEAHVLVHEGNRLRLSREGMLVAHEVMTVFV